MSNFPKVLEQAWIMSNSDLNVVGEYLGYGWNQVCDEIQNTEFYATEGYSIISVEKNIESDYPASEILNKIIKSIFEEYPEVDEIFIVNDF